MSSASLNLGYGISHEWQVHAICREDKPASKLRPKFSCKGNVRYVFTPPPRPADSFAHPQAAVKDSEGPSKCLLGYGTHCDKPCVLSQVESRLGGGVMRMRGVYREARDVRI